MEKYLPKGFKSVVSPAYTALGVRGLSTLMQKNVHIVKWC
jgi:hypothetical protein